MNTKLLKYNIKLKSIRCHGFVYAMLMTLKR